MKGVSKDIIGNITILKFRKRHLRIVKKHFARHFMKTNKSIGTVLEKTSDISGELRIAKVRHLVGDKTFEVIYKENGCTFKFNVAETYFSPRLSNERKVISDEVLKLCKKNKNTKILVMFAGVAPYPIIIAKKLKQAKIKFEMSSNELNKQANIYAKENARLNKVDDYIEFIDGDAKRLSNKKLGKFDIILMPRPNLEDTFLEKTLQLSKKGTTIFYHGFGKEDEVLKEIKKDTKNKIGKIKIRKAGDIAPHKYRWQAVFKVK